MFPICRVPDEPQQKAVVIDKNTYSRLLKSCNVKSKEDFEFEKQREDAEKDRIIVRIYLLFELNLNF
jgi:hypothetical protein